MENKEKQGNGKKRIRKRKVFSIFLFLLFFIPLLIFLLLQLSFVQNHLVDYFAKRISNSIDGEVTIERIDLSLSDGLELETFKLVEADGDTVLTADALTVDLSSSLYSLWDNQLAIRSISLESPHINLVKERGNSENNLALIINSIFKPKNSDTESGNPLKIDLSTIQVTDSKINIRDENKQSHQAISIEKGVIEIESFLQDNVLAIKSIDLTSPVFRIQKLSNDTYIVQDSSGILDEAEVEIDTNNLHVTIGRLNVAKGIFSYDDMTKKYGTESDILDYGHLELQDIDLDVSDFDLSDDINIKMNLNQLDFLDNKGFEVKKLSCEGVSINSKSIDFPKFHFLTDRTSLKESLRFEFDSFDDLSDFEQKVYLKSRFSNSNIYLADLMHFIGKLNTSEFFVKNKTKTISLSGKIKGTVDNLIGNDVEIRIGEDLVLDANFSTRNLTVKDRELLNISIKNLGTDIEFLRDFIPNFSPPQNFYKLGQIGFKGNFDGFLKDFVAYGSLKSSAGDAFLDMRLDIKDGSNLAQYSGDLTLDQFDLGAWTDNSDFGNVDFSAEISDGRGLTLNSIYSNLYAVIKEIEYKGYTYRDFEMDAQVDQNKFNGEFIIADENIDLIFDGDIELRENIPYMNFKANVEKLDLYALNLIDKPFAMRGVMDIDLYGKNINDVVGGFVASDLGIATNDTVYLLDTLSLRAFESQENNRRVDLHSDVASIHLEGQYDVTGIVPTAKNLLIENYPHYTQNWEVAQEDVSKVQKLNFDIEIKDSRNLLELVGINDVRTKNFRAKGSLDSKKGDLSFASSIPFLKQASNALYDSQILISSTNKSGDLLINIDSMVVGSNSYNPIDIQSRMVGDTVNFFISTTELVDSLESIDIRGRMTPHPDGYMVNITDNKIEALGSEWSFDKSNEIIIGDKYHSIENLTLRDGYRTINISDIDNRGISAQLSSFNFITINGLIDYDKMSFAGEGDVELNVLDVYTMEKFGATVQIPEFTINNDSYGALDVVVNKEKDNPISADILLSNGNEKLIVQGTFDTDNGNKLEANVSTEEFPVKIFEYLLKDGIKNTYGTVNMDATVSGPLDNLDIDGKGKLDGGVTIIYTGVEYKFDDQIVTMDETSIDLTGVEIIDPEGGIGNITGGLYHSMFRDFNLDAVISGQDVVALNTTKQDNPLYYGYGKGDMRAHFTGPFHLVNMRIVSTAKEGSVLNIPIWEGETSADKNFIEFVRREELFEKEKIEDKDFRFEGLDIEVNLTLTPAARVNIIFDESRGDIIQGNGRGNLKMNITRYGDFDMYGTYDIENGEYLFTALNAVAKPFKVRRGGQIRWTGDPINATLDITADYGVRTSMELFLSEFVVPDSPLATASRSTTDVELVLNLGGTLFNPKVNFDLGFPAVDGELRTRVESKMRTLRANQAELNSQVLGLIVFNSFLPSSGTSTAGATADIGNTGIGTLSEFVSSQLSLLFTGLLNEALADNGLISGIDFDIGLRKTSLYGVSTSNSDILPDEIEVHLKNRFKFLDERLSLGLGGNYVRDNVLIGGDYFIGDFVIEYFLTDNRKLKLRMYGRYDYDEFYRERRQKYGVGLGYRTEFGSLSDFKETMSKQFREQIGEGESQ